MTAELETETVVFNPLRFQRDEALGIVTRAAASHELQIDKLEERRGRFTVDLLVTVTGSRKQIRAFCKETKGHDPLQADNGGFSWDLIVAAFRGLGHLFEKL